MPSFSESVIFTSPRRHGPHRALAGVRQISGSVAGAQQPLSAVVKNAVRLPVKRHRHVGTAVQISVRLSLEPNRKGLGCLASVVDVKQHSLPTLDHIVAVTKILQFV